MAPKRAQDAGSPNTPDANMVKRPKASRACATCRKTKSRCELLDVAPGVNGRLQCHRCKVLDIECSFHNSDIIIVARHNEASTSGHARTNTPGQQQSTRSSPSTEQFGVQKDFTSHNEVELPEEGADVLDAESYVLGPWRVLGIADDAYWTREPILAVRGILPPLPAHEPNGLINYQDDSLTSILPHARIRYLIDIFETRYRPWMSLPPANVNDTALDLVRCAIAARHLDPKTRSNVAPRLQALVETSLLQPGYPHTKTIEFVEALLILALWTPICGSGYAVERDSRLLASSAMQIAISLGLNQYDNIQVLQQRKQDAPNDPDPEVVRKTRLWCAASNIEHMLLVGAGRDPQSRRTPEERRADFTASYSTLDPRDIRLGLSRRLFDLADIGSSVCWGPSRAEQEHASKEVNDLIASFNWLYRLITPLPVVFQLDAFYFSMLEVSYHVYKMKTLYRNLYGLKAVFDRPYKEWLRLELNGLPIAAVWGREMVALSEAAIVSLLSRLDVASLSTAPDPYFLLITYAGLSLLTTKIAVYHIGFPSLVGHGDTLLDMTMERLQQAALSPDHISARCATTLREAVATWDRKREEGLAAKQFMNNGVQDKPMDCSAPISEQTTPASGLGTSSEPFSPIDPLVSMFDPFFGVSMSDEVDPGLLFDPQFVRLLYIAHTYIVVLSLFFLSAQRNSLDISDDLILSTTCVLVSCTCITVCVWFFMSVDERNHTQELEECIEQLSGTPDREQVAAELGALQSIYGDGVLKIWLPDGSNGSPRTGSVDEPLRFEITLGLLPPHEEITVHLLISLPPTYPSTSPPQLQLLSRYIGAFGADSNLFGAILRVYISVNGVEWAADSICVFDGLQRILELCTEWYDEKLTNHAIGQVIRDAAEETHNSKTTTSTALLNSDTEENHRTSTVTTAPNFGIPEGIQIFEAEPITDRKSSFVGRACRISHPSQVPLILSHLKSDRKIFRAAHPIINAWRCHVGNVLHQDNDDDGETAAGGRLAHLLQILDVDNVLIVVTRYFGGIHLGPDRFKHINQAARNALDIGGFLDAPDTKKATANRAKKR